jgi:DNA polymerase-3 subunit gamma/tau
MKKLSKKKEIISDFKSDSIDQIKNITQEKQIKPQTKTEIKAEKKITINSFDDLLKNCAEKKEMKLKYELEKNVNLVRFEKNRIEISFNDNLDKNFVKELSIKLFEWTDQRWIITFSKEKGQISIKEKQQNKKTDILNKAKQTEIYKTVIEKFPDANLFDVKPKNE